MEIKGKVIQVMDVVTGMGKKGPWKKQEFVIETQSQYPKKVVLSIWGDKVDEFDIQEGQLITAQIELESREYNGRWYTEVRCWKMEGGHSRPKPAQQPSTPRPDPMDEPMSGNASDDLPF